MEELFESILYLFDIGLLFLKWKMIKNKFKIDVSRDLSADGAMHWIDKNFKNSGMYIRVFLYITI